VLAPSDFSLKLDSNYIGHSPDLPPDDQLAVFDLSRTKVLFFFTEAGYMVVAEWWRLEFTRFGLLQAKSPSVVFALRRKT
jgi:hypothetical protein